MSKGMYRNEVEMPSMPKEGRMEPGMGMGDFFGEADPIAHGQTGVAGAKSDDGKIKSQFKNYGWD